MHLILAVYDALRSYDRACTRAEIEAATDLGKDDVRAGLRGLQRRGDLIVIGSERQRAMYRLRTGAERPIDLRGKAAKDEETRARMAEAHRRRVTPSVALLDHHHYSAARPPSHRSEPGALRTTKHGPRVASNVCALQHFWRRKG